MVYTQDKYNYTLRLERGEELVGALAKFITEQDLKAGWILGLGGLTWAELGFYDLNAKKYNWKKLNIGLELISLSGNIAVDGDGNPALHLHAAVGDEGLRTYGGHLKAAEVAGTVEIFIHRWLDDDGFRRKKDENTGLNLLNI